MSEEIKNKEMMDGEELSLDDLEEVTGGSGLRKVNKERTYDISEDTRTKI